jgi:hypothetical protein
MGLNTNVVRLPPSSLVWRLYKEESMYACCIGRLRRHN